MKRKFDYTDVLLILAFTYIIKYLGRKLIPLGVRWISLGNIV